MGRHCNSIPHFRSEYCVGPLGCEHERRVHLLRLVPEGVGHGVGQLFDTRGHHLRFRSRSVRRRMREAREHQPPHRHLQTRPLLSLGKILQLQVKKADNYK